MNVICKHFSDVMYSLCADMLSIQLMGEGLGEGNTFTMTTGIRALITSFEILTEKLIDGFKRVFSLKQASN